MIAGPLISVILPVYNTEKYVSEAINSILSQTYSHFELICINDGSTDNSLNILKSFKQIKLLDSKINCGGGEARNKGIKIATGDFIAFMDADDIWKNNKLELQMAKFKNNIDLAICFTYMQCFISPELSETIKNKRYCPSQPILGYIPPTALIKKTEFEKTGYFDPSLKIGEFIEWFNRAKEIGLKVDILDDILVLRRIHETNTGITARESRSDYFKIVRQALERKKNNIEYEK